MRVLHVALDINPAQGGPPRSIVGLCRALAPLDMEVGLFVHDRTGACEANLGRCHLYTGTGRGLSGSWKKDFVRVLDEFRPDIVHQHALWNLPLHFDDCECRRRGIPYIITPRGLLDEWSLSQKRLKKQIALALYQRHDLKKAVAIHATCEKEAEYSRRVGCCEDVIISPNGVNLPSALPSKVVDRNRTRRFLFLSRIHPKKGLMNLVRAWSCLAHEGWLLEIVGNDSEGYWKRVQDEIDRLGCGESIQRTDFLNDTDKWAAYRRADVFVLPTYTENFGIVIAEALYAGLPVITTKGAPWEGIAKNNAGWWIDVGVDPLVSAMQEAMKLSDVDRDEMGTRGRAYVEDNFDWHNIAVRLRDEYKKILHL